MNLRILVVATLGGRRPLGALTGEETGAQLNLQSSIFNFQYYLGFLEVATLRGRRPLGALTGDYTLGHWCLRRSEASTPWGAHGGLNLGASGGCDARRTSTPWCTHGGLHTGTLVIATLGGVDPLGHSRRIEPGCFWRLRRSEASTPWGTHRGWLWTPLWHRL